MRIKIHRIASATAVVVLLSAFGVLPASAAQFSDRGLTLTSSAASAVTSHKFDFTVPTTASIGSIGFLYCTTASGSCTKPTGLTTTSATLSAQSGATGFTIDNTVDGAPFVTRTASAISATTVVSYTLGTVTNPSATNTTFYVRITSYTGTDGATGATDTGTVAASTGTQISLTGQMDESLVFCVGTSVTGTNCGTVAGSLVDFGTFSVSTVRTGTSVMVASTNARNGYSITVNGATLTSGVKTIPALTTQTASSVGTSQFGLNLKANSTPSVGSEVSGSGSGVATANYGTADQFRFVTGDSVATAATATDANAFTVSYIANVAGAQSAGIYTATMTYICTASF